MPARRRLTAACATLAAATLTAPAVASAQAVRPTFPAGAVVSAADVVPGLRLDVRYATAHNFTGRPVPGYEEPLCLLTRPAAEALARVQARVASEGFVLKAYDCYRPQSSVDSFVRWGRRLGDQRMKAEFYPREPKARVFRDGYIAAKSGHSRASTIDLTLVRGDSARREGTYRPGQPLVDCAAPRRERFRDTSIDMGTGYDCFE